MPYRTIALTTALIAIASLSLIAAEKHSQHAPSVSHQSMSTMKVLPEQGGQAAFAALIEIVALLEADPETDWSTIDIDGLHQHLQHMNTLMLETNSITTILSESEIRYDVTGNTSALQSIHELVPAHAQFIEQSRAWQIKTDLGDTGAQLLITVEEPASLVRLEALGFYGFMSLDGHHQAHHYQMARGHSH